MQMQKERAPTCKGGQDPRSLSNLKQYNMQKTVPVQERNYKALKETAKKWRNYVQSCRRAKEKKRQARCIPWMKPWMKTTQMLLLLI